MTPEKNLKKIIDTLQDLKAMDIQVLDVTDMTSITDIMIIASGRSNRQVKAMANNVIETAKALDLPVLGVEGEREGEWVLVDLGDIVAHLMQPATRAYYQLEKLWSVEYQQSTSMT
ncbi:MAG: ribosome silencing factor [Gammaproteobacteria bacterium]|nr:ribosome silencing factor [Gammaproteobacteria bacterium]